MKTTVLRQAKLLSGETADLCLHGDTIAGWAEAGTIQAADEMIDCSGWYVSPGWTDMHVHAFADFTPYGDEIDEIGVKQGVTTIVDAGSCGADRIGELAGRSETALTRLMAFLNISRIGLLRVDELSDMAWIDESLNLQALHEYRDFLVGWKARISSSVVGHNGIKPLQAAVRLSDASGKPIMVHIGSGPPAISDIVGMLRSGDIITHYLHGKSNGLFEGGKPIPALTEALIRGVCLDVGHGSASFSFETAEAAKACGIPLGTISTDIYRGNRENGPVYSLSHVLSKLLHIGYSLKEVIDAVTIRPASLLGRPELADLSPGCKANITLFSLERGQTVLTDSSGGRRTANQMIKARGAIINGSFIAC